VVPMEAEETTHLYYYLCFVFEDGSTLCESFKTIEDAEKDLAFKELRCKEEKIVIIHRSIVPSNDPTWKDVWQNAMKEKLVETNNKLLHLKLSGRAAMQQKLQNYKRPVRQAGVRCVYNAEPK